MKTVLESCHRRQLRNCLARQLDGPVSTSWLAYRRKRRLLRTHFMLPYLPKASSHRLFRLTRLVLGSMCARIIHLPMFQVAAERVRTTTKYRRIISDYLNPTSKGTVCVCHHGAGFSALSFAHLARQLTAQSNGELGVLAFDARGHGKTKFVDERREIPADLSLERLSADLTEILAAIFPEPQDAPNLLVSIIRLLCCRQWFHQRLVCRPQHGWCSSRRCTPYTPQSRLQGHW